MSGQHVISLNGMSFEPVVEHNDEVFPKRHDFSIICLGDRIGNASLLESEDSVSCEDIKLSRQLTADGYEAIMLIMLSYATTKKRREWLIISDSAGKLLDEQIRVRCESCIVDGDRRIRCKNINDLVGVDFYDEDELSKITIEPCTEDNKEEWDRFIDGSVNGTFLQSMKFLDYHPKGRFEDYSLMIRRNRQLIAIVPGCRVGNAYFSHRGSTFGGIIVDKEHYDVQDVKNIFYSLEQHLQGVGIREVTIKPTSNLFCRCSNDLFDYLFFRHDYICYSELSFYIDCTKIQGPVIESFTKHKRKHYKESQRFNLVFREFRDPEEIAAFHGILTKNLSIHGKAPTHSLDELLDLYQNRIGDRISFFGVYLEERMIAGTMLFRFSDDVIHTQYIATDYDYVNTQCTYYLYGRLIEMIKSDGFKTLSFGISTESNGMVLNEGLASLKEGFGSSYSINRTYVKRWPSF